MNAETRPTVATIGMGRLGTSLAAALSRAGYTVLTEQSAPTAQLTFLTVPDRAIAEVAGSRTWRPGQWVVHCSGALGLEELAAPRSEGVLTGCFHPLQTFPSRTAEPERFRGIAIGIEATEPLRAALERIAVDLGSQPFHLAGVDRALYHAAAVVASNHLIALASAATRLWALAGLPEADGRQSLAPLITAAATNVATRDLVDALTGPIVRGDAATVARHLAALDVAPDLRELYRLLSLELLRLPLTLPGPAFEALETLLEPPSKEHPK